MNALTSQIEELLRANGADLVGFADLRGIEGAGLPYGVSAAIAIPPEIIRSIHDGPTPDYLDAYRDLNRRLDHLSLLAAQALKDKGFRSVAQVSTMTALPDDLTTPLPHKTVATRAGLGFIGRCALLVTEAYGSGIRLTSILTDAPFTCGEPVMKSRCGDCVSCVKHCPGGAVLGGAWQAGMPRENLYDAYKCRETARAASAERLKEQVSLCGKCIEICPYTQKYLSNR